MFVNENIKKEDLPLHLTIGIDSTLVSPDYHMALKIIKQNIKKIIRSITSKSIISKIREKYGHLMTKSKQDHNIKFITYQINENSSNTHEKNNMTEIKQNVLENQIKK